MSTTPNPGAIQQAHESFWQHVKDFFHKVGYYVSEAFAKIFGEQAAKQFAAGALSILKTDLGKIVLEAVAEVQKVATGAEARAAAFAKAASTAKAAGIDAGESILNMLIELAVQTVKGNFGGK
jgi:hypothetical protein